MITFCRKYSALLLLSLLVSVLVLAWLFPLAGSVLGITFLLLSFMIAGAAILGKHSELYRKGRITRGVFLRNAALEITGTGLAMLLAGLIARYTAAIVTNHIDGNLLRFLAGVMIGLLVGALVGTFARQLWGRFVNIPSP